MAIITERARIQSDVQSGVPANVLETLAARFRSSGVFLLSLKFDGSITFHDPSAGLFFQRYVLPVLQWRESIDAEFQDHLSQTSAVSGIELWRFIPGVVLAAFPYIDRRAMKGIVLLAAKAPTFKLNENVVRTCSRLGVDGIWLSQQADELPALDDETLVRQARLLNNMLKDQVQLATMSQELESVSAELSNNYEELSLIYQLTSGMRVNRPPVEFFKKTCLDVIELMGVRGMGVVLRTGNGSSSEPVLYGGMSLPPGTVHRLADKLMTVLRERKAPLLINRLKKDKTFHWLADHAQQLLAVPLLRRENALGCLFGLDKLTDEFDTVDSKLLNSIANESAIYLENLTLYEDVQELFMGVLHSLISAVDAKDAYTCGHSERVALLSRVLAQEAGLDQALIERIYMSALLHDVGKIGVPEAVLQKAGRLTPEEYEQVKKHPEIGARILRDIHQIGDIIPGVLHHHERYDGRGYPAGLCGEDIPLMGRLICLADCFDAMTSSRTYRKALPLEVALTEIRRCCGTQFDPGLTDVFLSIGTDRLREVLSDHKRQAKQLIEMQQSLRAA